MTLADLVPTLITLSCTALLAPLCFRYVSSRPIEGDSHIIDAGLPPC